MNVKLPVDVVSLDHIDAGFSRYWVELIASSTQSSFFHQLHYLKMIQAVFERPVFLWYVFRKNHLKMGGFFVPSRFFGRILVQPYYLPYSDPLFYEPGDEHFISRISRMEMGLKDFAELIEKHFFLAEMEFSPQTENSRIFLGRRGWEVFPRFTYVVDLWGAGDVMSTFHKAERRQIRKRLDETEICEHVSSEEFTDLIFGSYSRHHQHPPLKKVTMMRWIEGMLGLAGMHFMGLRNRDGQLVSGLVYAIFKDKAYFILQGSVSDKGISFTPLLYYHVYHRLKEEGICMIDLLGGMHPSIAVFKLHVGGVPRMHVRLRFTRNKGSAVLSGLQYFTGKILRRIFHLT